MRTLFFILLLCFTSSLVAQDNSMKEYDSLMKEYQKELDKIQGDPEIRKALEQAGLSNSTNNKQADLQTFDLPLISFEPEKVKWGKLPAKKNDLLLSIPITVLKKAELGQYITGIDEGIIKPLNSSGIQAAFQVEAQHKNNPLAISRGAIVAWYKNSPQNALALATKAASSDPENPEILNTLAAILNLCGYEHKALPLLKYLLAHFPENSTVLNNTGQSYLGLGDTEKAEQYLKMAVAKTPNHTEANKSLGLIYNARGQHAAARQCFTNSLKGGYTETAYAGAEKSGNIESAVIFEFISGRFKKPPYFDAYSYQVPQLCENVTDAAQIRLAHLAFRYRVEMHKISYNNLVQQAIAKSQKKSKEYQDKITVSTNTSYLLNPLAALAFRIYTYYQNLYLEHLQNQKYYLGDYYKAREKLQTNHRFWKDSVEMIYRKKFDDLAQKWDRILQNNGVIDETELTMLEESHCKARDQVSNKYMFHLAQLQQGTFALVLGGQKELIQRLLYWKRFLNFTGDYELAAYNLISNYLAAVSMLANETEFILPSCYDKDPGVAEETTDDPDLHEADCPFNLSLNLIVGDLSLDCEKFGIDIKAGVSFTAEKNFVSRETTLAIGVGIGTSKELSIPVIGIEGGAGISEQFYIVFGKDNIPSDLGIKLQAGAKASAAASAGPAGTELISVGVSAGYTLGLNSGWNFD